MQHPLERILRLAGQTRQSVIVTDMGGRDPLVIVPLEVYERQFVTESGPFPPMEPDDLPPPDDSYAPVSAPFPDDLALESAPFSPPPVSKKAPAAGSDAPSVEGSAEEQFYLEPSDGPVPA